MPSLRLCALRDGQEDLNLLYALENKYKERASHYGVSEEEATIDPMLANVYSELFTGVVPTTDSGLFSAARTEVVDLYDDLDGAEQLLVTKLEESGTSVYAEFYVDEAYSVKVNGRTVFGVRSGNGYRYEYKMDMDQSQNYLTIEMTDGERTAEWSYYAGAMRKRATQFGGYMPDGALTVTEGSVLTIGEGYAEVLLASVKFEDDLVQTMEFRPGLEISSEIFDKELSEISSIEFMLTNLYEEDITLRVTFESNGEVYTYGNVVVGAGSSRTVLLDGLDQITSAALKGAGKIVISVENIHSDGSLYSDRTIRLGDIYYTEG